MAKKSHVLIDGQQYKTRTGQRKPSSLLQLAGKSPEDAVLVLEGGHVCVSPDEPIVVTPGDQFSTKERICYFVNGEPSTTIINPLSVESILQNAGAGAAVDIQDLGSYYLENTSDGRKYENLDSMVTIVDGDNFLAIHVGSTPVAYPRCGHV